VASDPMQQFEIVEKQSLFEIAGQSISWTNSSFWMVFSAILSSLHYSSSFSPQT